MPLIVNTRSPKSGLPPISAISGVMKRGGERRDDRAERRADDDRDRQLDHVAAHDEVAELLEHVVSLPSWLCSRSSMAAADSLHCLVEVPKGSRNKYEWDERLQAIKLDRFLFSSVVYPTDYGFIQGTLTEKGSALDAMVCVGAPTFPGIVIPVKVIAVFRTRDEAGPGRQAAVRPARGPELEPHGGARRRPGHAADRDRALLVDLQGARGQAGRDPGLGGPRPARSR